MAKTVFFDEKETVGASLVLFNNQGVISVTSLGAHTSIGRSSEQSTCDIKISSPIVSRSHGEIIVVNGEHHYRDLNSTNGTYVNDYVRFRAILNF